MIVLYSLLGDNEYVFVFRTAKYRRSRGSLTQRITKQCWNLWKTLRA